MALLIKDRISAQLRQAVRKGIVKKPNICDMCKKKFPKRSLSGHHKDYSKPFNIKWLCYKCHDIVERKLGNKVYYQKGYDSRRYVFPKGNKFQSTGIRAKIK